MKKHEFKKILLPSIFDNNPFEKLLNATHFEGVCKGRQGTVILEPDKSHGIPIVRTTTKYNSAAQCFNSVHKNLAKIIEQKFLLKKTLNNALVEIYDNTYYKMGFHTDQSQDLCENSYIAIYSCYKDPNKLNHVNRTLVIEPKIDKKDIYSTKPKQFKIPMCHNSVILWSLDTNRRYRHKIVLDKSKGEPPENMWLGITFRTSKTYVNFKNGICYLENGNILKLMEEDEKKQFYKLRSKENKTISFNYPYLSTTLSPSDLIPPYLLEN